MKPDIKTILSSWPKGVCHRGYHDLSRPENGRAAFQKAIENNLPFECDVHLTKDGEVVVCHDSDLSRVCGKSGIIEELTYQEIIQNYTLFDGSVLMTLKELLELREEKVGFVLELKSYQGNGKAVAEAVWPLIAKQDPNKLVLISFDPDALRPFKGKDFNLGLLIGQRKDVEFFTRHRHPIHEFDFLDVGVFFLAHFPMFRKYRRNGGSILCWTVRDEKDYRISEKYADCPTWEIVRSNEPLEGQKEDEFLRKKAAE